MTRDDILAKGVLFDKLLLLKPDTAHRDSVRAKIATTLTGVRGGIDAARSAGRHVLYLPGSYDLVHLGHALHIEQSVARYMSLPEHAGLAAENLFVLTLADDDDLVSSVKSYKFTDNGGNEPFRRPVQSAAEYRGARDVVHWRLFDLASVPRVQMAGFIPSPLQMEFLTAPDILTSQRDPDELRMLLNRFWTTSNVSEQDGGTLEAAIEQYRDLLRLLREEPARVASAFRQRIHPWSIQSWQLFVHCYLGAGKYDAPMTRMMSHQDDAHGYQVGFLMEAAGIRTQYLHEPTLVTTSELIAAHGAQALLDAKRANY